MEPVNITLALVLFCVLPDVFSLVSVIVYILLHALFFTPLRFKLGYLCFYYQSK